MVSSLKYNSQKYLIYDFPNSPLLIHFTFARQFPHTKKPWYVLITWEYFDTVFVLCDHLCGLVVRVSGYRYRGLGFDSRHYQIFCVAVGLERGALSLVRSIEELLE